MSDKQSANSLQPVSVYVKEHGSSTEKKILIYLLDFKNKSTAVNIGKSMKKHKNEDEMTKLSSTIYLQVKC